MNLTRGRVRALKTGETGGSSRLGMNLTISELCYCFSLISSGPVPEQEAPSISAFWVPRGGSTHTKLAAHAGG